MRNPFRTEAEAFSFDILDATKVIPEELAPVRIIGALDTPVPYSPPLEHAFLPGEAEVEAAGRWLREQSQADGRPQIGPGPAQSRSVGSCSLHAPHLSARLHPRP